MIDVSLPIRTAYRTLLNGAVFYNGTAVPITDEIKEYGNDVPVYVLLSTQIDVDTSTFSSFDSEHDINIDIVYKASNRVRKSVVDGIANQILNLVLPAPAVNGLPAQAGIQISVVRKSGDRSIPAMMNLSNTVIRRILTFRQHVRQTGDSTVTPNTLSSIKSPLEVTSADFDDATAYSNASLNGRTFSIFYNDGSKFLEYGVDWQYLTGGGFTILMPNFDSTLQSHVFYLLLN